MNDLDLSLELIDLGLHELLCNLCEEIQVEFYKTALHDLLTEFNGLLFALLDNLPQLIRQSVRSLVQLFLRLVILSQVWVLIGKLIKVLHKFVQYILLAVTRVQELQELHLQIRISNAGLLTLQTDVSENAFHLAFVVTGKFTP